jgi:catechol 2,3-dioxygenase-like lactoylglutathione lyase family enzyme
MQATPGSIHMPSGREQIGRRKETALDQRLSLITLGVRDVSRAQAFYEALGWHLDGGVDDETDHVAFFQTGGLILALWDRGKLERDSGVEDTSGWGGVTLAHNVRSPEEVDTVLAQARARGHDRPRRRRHVLGRLLGRLHRPRRPPLGGRAQPRLDRARGRPHNPRLMADALPAMTILVLQIRSLMPAGKLTSSWQGSAG